MEDLISKSAVIGKLSQGYWDWKLQQAKNDPCVIDAMIDWAIRIVNETPTEKYPKLDIDKVTSGNWHTGTPIEKGWYLLALTTKVFNDNPFCVAYMDGHHWLGIDDFCIFVDHVLAWQKIEPYRG